MAYVIARKRPGEERFGPLQVVSDTPNKPEGNGILFQNDRGWVVLIWGTMHGTVGRSAGAGGALVHLRSQADRLPRQTASPGPNRSTSIRSGGTSCTPSRSALADGRWLFGTEYLDRSSRIWASEDDGDSWEVIGKVPGLGNQHPTLIERKDGSVLALLRPRGSVPRVLWSVSRDGGRSWSEAEATELPCPFAAIDAVRLHDGRIVLAYNHNPERRNPLTLAVSEDEGKTWPIRRDLVTGEGAFHYPAIIQDRHGRLHITFTNNRRTIDHVALNVEWIYGDGPALRPWCATEAVRTTV
ncbi:MAG: hypothetical protein KatS3mg115_1914 [Candidatus Poribacteria bacterium]|nr:MAG: hypothetical protein KatS3mg115_1914 [Candidatus Poribacteria bacterium]